MRTHMQWKMKDKQKIIKTRLAQAKDDWCPTLVSLQPDELCRSALLRFLKSVCRAKKYFHEAFPTYDVPVGRSMKQSLEHKLTLSKQLVSNGSAGKFHFEEGNIDYVFGFVQL